MGDLLCTIHHRALWCMRQLIQVEGAPILFLTSNNLCLYRPLAVQARVLTCKADSSPVWLFSYRRMVSLHPPSPVMAADIGVAFRSSWGCQHLRSSRGWESVPLLLETHRSWWVVALFEIITYVEYVLSGQLLASPEFPDCRFLQLWLRVSYGRRHWLDCLCTLSEISVSVDKE